MANKKAHAGRKQCARCLVQKPLEDFGKNPRMKQGRKSYCKKCSAELQKIWNDEQRKAEKAGGRRRRR